MPSEMRCPRCGKEFECRAESIAECQCSTVSLTADERTFISENFSGCLCAACLAEMTAARNI